QMDGPPAVVDGDHVVGIVKQGGEVEQGGTGQPQQQNAFRGGEAPGPLDGHADVVKKDQHAHDDGQLVWQRLFQQLVAGAVAEQVADDRRYTHDGPDDELDVGQLHAVEFTARFVRHDPVGGAHEA